MSTVCCLSVGHQTCVNTTPQSIKIGSAKTNFVSPPQNEGTCSLSIGIRFHNWNCYGSFAMMEQIIGNKVCCKSWFHYRCCPIEDGVCCGGGNQCCPRNQKCLLMGINNFCVKEEFTHKSGKNSGRSGSVVPSALTENPGSSFVRLLIQLPSKAYRKKNLCQFKLWMMELLVALALLSFTAGVFGDCSDVCKHSETCCNTSEGWKCCPFASAVCCP
ncbi:granulin [Trichonephila inaurata madagascariensis]|uniref:Granulin n=1 Tax=Trichonephila inaurata madagascariensis TaxID=2747483 RepID=A0A8X7CJM3_9ARAC|nr:granulin [Trichonephila inaurata madagascariensis]